MPAIDPENYSQGGLPTIFEERTLFPPPGQAVPHGGEPPRRRSSPLVGLFFLVLLALSAGLVFLLWQAQEAAAVSDKRIADLEKIITESQDQVGAAKVADLTAQITSLKADNENLKAQTAEFDVIKTLQQKVAEKKAEIADVIRNKPNGNRMPQKVRDLPVAPDWGVELQAYLKALEDKKTEVIRWTYVDPNRTNNPTEIQ